MKLDFITIGLYFLIGSIAWAGGGGYYVEQLSPEQREIARKEKEVRDAQAAEAVKSCKGYSTQALLGFLKQSTDCKFVDLKQEIKRQPVDSKTLVLNATCKLGAGQLVGLKIPHAIVYDETERAKGPLKPYWRDVNDVAYSNEKTVAADVQRLQKIPPQYVRDLLVDNYKLMQKDCEKTNPLIYIDTKVKPEDKFQEAK